MGTSGSHSTYACRNLRRRNRRSAYYRWLPSSGRCSPLACSRLIHPDRARAARAMLRAASPGRIGAIMAAVTRGRERRTARERRSPRRDLPAEVPVAGRRRAARSFARHARLDRARRSPPRHGVPRRRPPRARRDRPAGLVLLAGRRWRWLATGGRRTAGPAAVDTRSLLWIVVAVGRRSRCCGWWSSSPGYRMLLPRPASPAGRHVARRALVAAPGGRGRRGPRGPGRPAGARPSATSIAERLRRRRRVRHRGRGRPGPVRRPGAGQRPAARRRRRRGPRRRAHRHGHRGQHRHRDRRRRRCSACPATSRTCRSPPDSPLAEVYPDGFDAG